MLHEYVVEAPDPVALAHVFDIPWTEVAVRVGVTSDWCRQLAHDARHAHRVRRAVLELALERERLQVVMRA